MKETSVFVDWIKTDLGVRASISKRTKNITLTESINGTIKSLVVNFMIQSIHRLF